MPTIFRTVRAYLYPVPKLAIIAFLAAACGKAAAPADTPDSTAAAAPGASDPEATLMAKGLEQMGSAGDPIGAVATFRELLAKNPTHYGAHFQLARALDKAGQPDSARAWWTKVETMAQAVNDSPSVAVAISRLALPDTVSQEAMMAVGLNLMNVQNNPAAAVARFQALLKRNPTHYGATFQLAKALDKDGKPAEARTLWVKMLAMAQKISDQPTIDLVQARLKQSP